MLRICLDCKEGSKTALCEGLSKHVWNKYVVHGLSKSGKEWLDKHDPKQVYVTNMRDGSMAKLDEVTDAPLP